jgi:hypothetical protein
MTLWTTARGERGEYFAQLLRGTALVVVVRHVMQVDVMVGKVDVAVGISNQEIGQ